MRTYMRSRSLSRVLWIKVPDLSLLVSHICLCLYVPCYQLNPLPRYSAPEVVSGVLARILDNDSVLVDWSDTFQLNGLLQFYRLRRNSTPIFDGLDTSTVLFSEPKGQGKTSRVWGGVRGC